MPGPADPGQPISAESVDISGLPLPVRADWTEHHSSQVRPPAVGGYNPLNDVTPSTWSGGTTTNNAFDAIPNEAMAPGQWVDAWGGMQPYPSRSISGRIAAYPVFNPAVYVSMLGPAGRSNYNPSAVVIPIPDVGEVTSMDVLGLAPGVPARG